MDPNNQNPQGDSGTVNKLEQDLQNIKDQTTATQAQPVPEVAPVAQIPQVTEVPPDVSGTPAPLAVPADNSTFVPETPKKSSPLLMIAIILVLVAILAVVAYVFGAKLFNPQPTQNLNTVITPSVIPTAVSTETPSATVSASPTTIPTPTANSTATPSSSPSGTSLNDGSG